MTRAAADGQRPTQPCFYEAVEARGWTAGDAPRGTDVGQQARHPRPQWQYPPWVEEDGGELAAYMQASAPQRAATELQRAGGGKWESLDPVEDVADLVGIQRPDAAMS